MGGGSSSSSSSNTSIVETDNSNIQQNDNQIALNLEDIGDGNNITLSDAGAIEKAFEFGGDALDFGSESLRNSQEFGRDILSEASEISREAIQVAGNAQTHAFAKIKDIAASFTNSTSSSTSTILLAIGGTTPLVVDEKDRVHLRGLSPNDRAIRIKNVSGAVNTIQLHTIDLLVDKRTAVDLKNAIEIAPDQIIGIDQNANIVQSIIQNPICIDEDCNTVKLEEEKTAFQTLPSIIFEAVPL